MPLCTGRNPIRGGRAGAGFNVMNHSLYHPLLLFRTGDPEGMSCCRNTTARNCYNMCRMTPPACAARCGCIIINGNQCPCYPSLNLLPNSGEPDAIKYCNLGCVSSMCDTKNNAPEFVGEEMKIDMEHCSDACDRFCNGDARMASVAA
ncbi:hypothetical protein PVAP13_8KG086000 [Panicum virgatum]|uniref:Acidic protein n=1 Tax=Panicum virgatum TaxID=38727 RepID=A0A8T0PI76_PANVG|nr:hypothetical protein PVAP13_8KG086000 [Panicum virgatum]